MVDVPFGDVFLDLVVDVLVLARHMAGIGDEERGLVDVGQVFHEFPDLLVDRLDVLSPDLPIDDKPVVDHLGDGVDVEHVGQGHREAGAPSALVEIVQTVDTELRRDERDELPDLLGDRMDIIALIPELAHLQDKKARPGREIPGVDDLDTAFGEFPAGKKGVLVGGGKARSDAGEDDVKALFDIGTEVFRHLVEIDGSGLGRRPGGFRLPVDFLRGQSDAIEIVRRIVLEGDMERDDDDIVLLDELRT